MTPKPYVYLIANIVKVHDGDTVHVTVDLGFSTFRRVVIRLAGIDTPEVTGQQKVAGRAVRDWLIRRLGGAKSLVLHSTKLDKYGRSLGVVYADGESVNDQMIARNMALPYDGASRAGTWTQAKLAAALKSVD